MATCEMTSTRYTVARGAAVVPRGDGAASINRTIGQPVRIALATTASTIANAATGTSIAGGVRSGIAAGSHRGMATIATRAIAMPRTRLRVV